jgi:hypothetical protein
MEGTSGAAESLGSKDQGLQTLANDPVKDTSGEAIGTSVEVRNAATEDGPTGAERRVLLNAGNLPAIVQLLCGDVGPEPTAEMPNMPSTIRQLAGNVLARLLETDVGVATLASGPDLVPHLTDALRDAPTEQGRCAAAHGLMILAHAKPAYRKAMAEAGVMGLLLALYIKLGADSLSTPEVEHVLELAHTLVRSETRALRDLRRAIQVSDKIQAFAAMLILQVSHSCSQ